MTKSFINCIDEAFFKIFDHLKFFFYKFNFVGIFFSGLSELTEKPIFQKSHQFEPFIIVSINLVILDLQFYLFTVFRYVLIVTQDRSNLFYVPFSGQKLIDWFRKITQFTSGIAPSLI